MSISSIVVDAVAREEVEQDTFAKAVECYPALILMAMLIFVRHAFRNTQQKD